MDKFHTASKKLHTCCDLGVKCVVWKPQTKRQLKRIVNKMARKKLKKELNKELNG